jgi:putative ABC transport system permease protein
MDLELRLHIEHCAEDLVRGGMKPEDAQRRARLEFGAIEARKDECREALGLHLIDALAADLRYAIRRLMQTPGFTTTALAALALGIGATTAIFSIVNTVLLKPLPVFDSNRLVMLMNTFVSEKGETGSNTWASPAKFAHWREESSVLQDVAAYRTGVMNYTGGDVAEQVNSMQMSADFLRCMGVSIIRGRGIAAEEDVPDGPHVALIGQDLWQRRFAGDPQILGRTISLSGDSYTVVGVVAHNPAWLEFGPLPDVFVPFQLDPNTRDQGHYFVAIARLKPGVSLEQAKARLRESAAEFRTKFPNVLGPRGGFTVAPYREVVMGGKGIREALLVLQGAVVLVLLIACANVANLLLARAAGRRREIAIRTAIGAGRGRMVRQLLTESLLLSLAGGALGLLLGFAGIRVLLAVNTAGLPRVGANGMAVAMDWRVMGFALLVSLATGILFGLLPALQGSRADLNSLLKSSSGRGGTGFMQNKARAALVVSEVGLAVILLVGSALLIRTFVAMYSVDPGFDTKNVLTMRMSMTGPKFLKAMGVAGTVRDGVERIRSLPGVLAATATCCVPLEAVYGLPFNVIGRPPTGGGPYSGQGGWLAISPGYFEMFKIPVKRGRTFTDRDDDKSPAVVVINEAMAREYWKDGDPLTDRVIIGRGLTREFKDEPVRQIVGIVGDVRDAGLNEPPHPNMYVPQAQITDAFNAFNVRNMPLAWVVRTQAEPHALAPAIRERLREVTGLPVSDVHSMDEVVSLSTARQRFNMLLMTVFGSAALLLAAVGIYGLMAYSVEQRTQEIGIRLALGAGGSQIKRTVVLQGMRLALAGVAIGITLALGLTRFLASFLFGVQARDPAVFAAVPMVLGAVAFLAVWFPASRASRIDPVEALRYE